MRQNKINEIQPYNMSYCMLWVLLSKTQKYFLFTSWTLQTCFIWQKRFFGLYGYTIHFCTDVQTLNFIRKDRDGPLKLYTYISYLRVTVWCGFWSRGIILPFFFENEQGETVTINGNRYRAMLNKFLFTKIEEEGIGCVYAWTTLENIATLLWKSW